VEIEDRHVTSTPEGVSLSVVLAGAGSRAGAYLIDFAVQVFVIIVSLISLGFFAGTSTSAYVVAGVFAFVVFAMTFGYFVLFETFDSGRSLGKRALGLRVTRLDGSGVTFRASLVRNIMRVLYAIPLFYLVDGILILATERNQRLGDLLAGTIVVRTRFGDTQRQIARGWSDPGVWSGLQPQGPPWGYGAPNAPQMQWLPPELAAWDVTAVTQSDLTVVRAYLGRRFQYDPVVRRSLAEDLASRILPRVAGVSLPIDPERFLEWTVTLKSMRG
jgi:uncharacterized RDD family membrane protein YckC